jgi:SAM-dependent methyltransferase
MNLKERFLFRRYRDRSHADVFSEIYRRKAWGGLRGKTTDYCSGRGSFPRNTVEYERFVVDFINQNAIGSMVDLGCGDFQVSQRILASCQPVIGYVGIDVVPELITRNRARFASDRVWFVCADATQADLPGGDLIIIREVLQHLSNDAIAVILEKVRRFRYAIITNTVSPKPTRINMDIVAGAATRDALGSGLWLDRPPFDFPCAEALYRPHRSNGSYFRTVVYRRD